MYYRRLNTLREQVNTTTCSSFILKIVQNLNFDQKIIIDILSLNRLFVIHLVSLVNKIYYDVL